MLRIKKHLPSGTVVIDRPERRNALSRGLMEELQQAFHDLHQERKVRAVILTGAGLAFSAGMDLSEMRSSEGDADAQQRWYDDTVLFRDLIETILRFPKPIIAAVNGPALGGGAGLVLASDIVIATPEAQFGLPEPRRGIVAGMVAPLLAFRVGGGWSANLLMTARTLSADEALRLGLYHEIVKNEMVWARAHQVAEQIAELSPEALQLTKRLLNETIAETLWTQLSAGAAASATSRTTEAAREGLAAFFEKRPPKWL